MGRSGRNHRSNPGFHESSAGRYSSRVPGAGQEAFDLAEGCARPLDEIPRLGEYGLELVPVRRRSQIYSCRLGELEVEAG